MALDSKDAAVFCVAWTLIKIDRIRRENLASTKTICACINLTLIGVGANSITVFFESNLAQVSSSTDEYCVYNYAETL